ncbi:Uncharacterised protein [Mycobacteroides abscessus subsp. abscessus]|nr:Uncharacterised protein [Mycobacteroides abscessus subsp. abscessus]
MVSTITTSPLSTRRFENSNTWSPASRCSASRSGPVARTRRNFSSVVTGYVLTPSCPITRKNLKKWWLREWMAT